MSTRSGGLSTTNFHRAGFTGADLQNLMNEAAILAARRELKEISKEEIADALERIVAGPEKKGAVMSEQKKKLVAYHEVRSRLLPLHIVAIHIPRRRKLHVCRPKCRTILQLTSGRRGFRYSSRQCCSTDLPATTQCGWVQRTAYARCSATG